MSRLPRPFRRTAALIIAAAIASLLPPPVAAQSSKVKQGMPEIFNGRARVATETARGDVYWNIQIDSYTPEKELKGMQQALQSGGSAGFVEALKKAPVAGHLKIGDKTFTIRWARKQPSKNGHVISLVTDGPVYYVGAGLPDAKPREGYDVAVIRIDLDSSNTGTGTMAAAARVKAGGASGVEIEDYGAEPVKLVSVMRMIS
ncbi:MAG TPA: hypothetical protein VL484_06085 [Vicinamibacterales bacterium]|jgi:hypothetical protein|nr:hypothetical protein [Vicinamibacterales bacterium]